MMRLRNLGRPPRQVIGIFIAGLALIAIGLFVIHGTPTTYTHIPGEHGRVAVNETGLRDIIRLVLAIAGVIVIGFGFVRWNDAREQATNADEETRRYGDSIVDVRTSIDPAIGMRPVDSEPRRH
jgi:uncharacterized membrane protein YidH (DUF202 family)